MIDAIIHIPALSTFVQWLAANRPEQIATDEDGNMTLPFTVIGFARTPSVIAGDAALVYCRFREAETQAWRDTPGVEILAEAPYTGKGTGDAIYAALFADPDATAKYDAVYDRTPREVDDGEGGTITVTPPDRFGLMAGA